MQLTISLHIIIPNGTIKDSGIGLLFQSKVSRKRQDLSAGANGSVECLTTIIETRRDGDRRCENRLFGPYAAKTKIIGFK